MSMSILRGDARHLPLADESVDLICTSPPYFALRSYQDGGEHFAGQIGSEATPQEWIKALLECTREFVRVLKPSGSIFVNLGDKYSGAQQQNSGRESDEASSGYWRKTDPKRTGIPNKSLMLLPERYRIGAVDRLGLIARAVIIWDKPNGLPESVTDRVRRSHEDWVHLTKQPRYYSAVDEVREGYAPGTAARYAAGFNVAKRAATGNTSSAQLRSIASGADTGPPGENPLGKLPGSVWSIPSEPLQVPPELGVDHFAAYPTEWPRRIIAGWSPPGICTACGEGRRPMASSEYTRPLSGGTIGGREGDNHLVNRWAAGVQKLDRWSTITGYACACTPHTDHPGTGESTGPSYAQALADGGYIQGFQPRLGAALTAPSHLGNRPRSTAWREYHFDRWTPAPTRPAVVLDPFAGTGTTLLVADVLGRHGIGIDLSADYCRLAAWRTGDPASRAKAARVDKPPPVIDGQLTLELL